MSGSRCIVPHKQPVVLHRWMKVGCTALAAKHRLHRTGGEAGDESALRRIGR